jgi:hypothetical protein
MASSSSSTTEFDVEGFILCLAAYLLGADAVEKKLLLQHVITMKIATTMRQRPRRIFWKSPLLVSGAEETTEQTELDRSHMKMDPAIVLLNAMFEYNPTTTTTTTTTATATTSSSFSSASKLSLQWGALVYNKNGSDDNNCNNTKYYYVESPRLTLRDLQLHFGALDVPLYDVDNDISVLAKNMAMALLRIGCNKNTSSGNKLIPAPLQPPPPNTQEDDDDDSGVLKFPLYYQGFEMYSSITLAQNLNHVLSTNCQKENDIAASTSAADTATATATISPYALGQWRAMLDACASTSSLSRTDASDSAKTTVPGRTSPPTKSNTKEPANEDDGNNRQASSSSQQQDEKTDVAVKSLLRLYNTSFRHYSCETVEKQENSNDNTAASAPSPHDIAKFATATLQPTSHDVNDHADDNHDGDDDGANNAATTAVAVAAGGLNNSNKKKKRRRPKGGYYEQKKAKPLAYADD